MGCTCTQDSKLSKDSLGEEEVANIESALVFASLPATKIATEVLVFSHAFWMNRKQVKDFVKALGVNERWMEEEGTPKERLMEMFRDRKKYSARKISLLGVLLGSGNTTRKAEILFGLYRYDDEQCELTAAQVYQLVQDACEVALLALPQYSKLELELLNDLSGLSKLHKYMDKLVLCLPSVVDLLADSILQHSDSVSEVHLKSRITGTEAKSLCSAAELRLLALKTALQRKDRSEEVTRRPRPSSSNDKLPQVK